MVVQTNDVTLTRWRGERGRGRGRGKVSAKTCKGEGADHTTTRVEAVKKSYHNEGRSSEKVPSLNFLRTNRVSLLAELPTFASCHFFFPTGQGMRPRFRCVLTEGLLGTVHWEERNDKNVLCSFLHQVVLRQSDQHWSFTCGDGDVSKSWVRLSRPT